MITNEPEIICGYKRAVLTPNAIEFSRLYEKMVLKLIVLLFYLSSLRFLFPLKQFGEKLQSSSDSIDSETRQLAAKMGNITVLRKGKIDSISDGNKGK